VVKPQLLVVLLHLVSTQLLQMQRVLQDELVLQHLHDEFFHRYQYQLLAQDLRQVQMQAFELGESHMHPLVVILVQQKLALEEELQVLQ
jgi:hypothetical protein